MRDLHTLFILFISITLSFADELFTQFSPDLELPPNPDPAVSRNYARQVEFFSESGIYMSTEDLTGPKTSARIISYRLDKDTGVASLLTSYPPESLKPSSISRIKNTNQVIVFIADLGAFFYDFTSPASIKTLTFTSANPSGYTYIYTSFQIKDTGFMLQIGDYPYPPLPGKTYASKRFRWEIFDQTQAAGALVLISDHSYTPPLGSGTKVKFLSHLEHLTSVFCSEFIIGYSGGKNIMFEDYILKTILHEIPLSSFSSGDYSFSYDIRYMPDAQKTVVAMATGNLRIYDYTIVGGPVLVDVLNNPQAIIERIQEIPNSGLYLANQKNTHFVHIMNVTNLEILQTLKFSDKTIKTYDMSISDDGLYTVFSGGRYSSEMITSARNDSCYSPNCLSCFHAGNRGCDKCRWDSSIYAGVCYECSNEEIFAQNEVKCRNEDSKNFYDWEMKQTQNTSIYYRKRDQLVNKFTYEFQFTLEGFSSDLESIMVPHLEEGSLEVEEDQYYKLNNPDATKIKLDFLSQYQNEGVYKMNISAFKSMKSKTVIFKWKAGLLVNSTSDAIFALKKEFGFRVVDQDKNLGFVERTALFIARNSTLTVLITTLFLTNLIGSFCSVDFGGAIIKLFQILEICSRLYFIPIDFGPGLSIILSSLAELSDVINLDPSSIFEVDESTTFPYRNKITDSRQLANMYNSIPLMSIIILLVFLLRNILRKKVKWEKKLQNFEHTLIETSFIDILFYSFLALIQASYKLSFKNLLSLATSTVVLALFIKHQFKQNREEKRYSTSKLTRDEIKKSRKLLKIHLKVYYIKITAMLIVIVSLQTFNNGCIILCNLFQLGHLLYLSISVPALKRIKGKLYVIKELIREIGLAWLLLISMLCHFDIFTIQKGKGSKGEIQANWVVFSVFLLICFSLLSELILALYLGWRFLQKLNRAKQRKKAIKYHQVNSLTNKVKSNQVRPKNSLDLEKLKKRVQRRKKNRVTKKMD